MVDRTAARLRRAAVAERRAAREARPRSEEWVVHHQRLQDLSHVPDDSVDLLLTDPPYEQRYQAVWQDLGALAARILKPGGSFVALAGHAHLPVALAHLQATDGLRFHWIIAYCQRGASRMMFQRRVSVQWKPLVWCVKGRYTGEFVADRIDVPPLSSQQARAQRRHHRWGQNELGFRLIIKDFAAPGDTVCDPMVGGGTTGLAARWRGCRFIGADVDQEAVATARARIGAWDGADT